MRPIGLARVWLAADSVAGAVMEVSSGDGRTTQPTVRPSSRSKSVANSVAAFDGQGEKNGTTRTKG